MPRLPLTAAAAAAALLLVAACGDDDASTGAPGGDATRTIEIQMVDIAFEPETIDVEAGETVRFVFTNDGEVAHDAYIGDTAAQDDHEAEMRDADGDEHGGGHGDDDPDALTVEPGDTGELIHTFTDPGTIEIGCHQPGHYDAGMKIDVEVA
jgi:uncharacterized cupredoxin-like copper-binding protein